MSTFDSVATAAVRRNLTDTLNRVHYQRQGFILMRRTEPVAVLLPPDFADLITAAGGLDAARKALTAAAHPPPHDDSRAD